MSATGATLPATEVTTAGHDLPELGKLPPRQASDVYHIDPALPVLDTEGQPLVSSGITINSPAHAIVEPGGFEWAVYSAGAFSPEDPPHHLSLDLGLSSGNIWFGLANFGKGVWEWQRAFAPFSQFTSYDFPAGPQYFRDSDGAAFIAIAIHDAGELHFNGAEVRSTSELGAALHVTHRSGQSFITWPEDTGQQGERYNVYRSGQPIDADNLSAAEVLYTVPAGSGNFYADRWLDFNDDDTWKVRTLERYVISELGPELPADTGLLVWTLSPEDFAGAEQGYGYYAVTVVDSLGIEDSLLSAELQFGPVWESVDRPLPVNAREFDEGLHHIMIQYMDLRNWNPTFHAPNPLNGYYGLASGQPEVAQAIQYAYPYHLVEPDPETTSGSPMPLLTTLHGWAENGVSYPKERSTWFDAIELWPLDVGDSWWFGMAQEHDYRTGMQLVDGDVIANYTEQRVLRMITDLLHDPELGPRIDPERLYLSGSSMGGSGAIGMAMRYPQLLAGVYAGVAMTNISIDPRWLPDAQRKFGAVELNLPVTISAPDGLAGLIMQYDGTGYYDWQNHVEQLTLRRGDPMAPIALMHTRQDELMDYAIQAQPVYQAFNAADRCWGGLTQDGIHETPGWFGFPPSIGPNEWGAPWIGLSVLRKETVPGLANASSDSPLPPSPNEGVPDEYNLKVEWSASWHDFAGPPLDTPQRWEMVFRSVDEAAYTVDVTPRRTQHFHVEPGLEYHWENLLNETTTVIAEGDVIADEDGLVTIPNFWASPLGNRLVITPSLDSGPS